METSVPTSFGEVSLDKLVKYYETYKRNEDKRLEKRHEVLQTPEGKAINRARAKAYYDKHKDDILAKRKANYNYVKKKKDTA